MRVANVVGRVSLVKAHPSIQGMRWVLAVPLSLPNLAADAPASAEELVVMDELGAAEGDRIGVSEGMEATYPLLPTKAPIDAYNVCLLERLDLDEGAIRSLTMKQ